MGIVFIKHSLVGLGGLYTSYLNCENVTEWRPFFVESHAVIFTYYSITRQDRKRTQRNNGYSEVLQISR